MSEAAARRGGVTEVHAARLFNGSCLALTSGAMMFAITSDIMGALKRQFILNNEAVGWIVGAGGWGFTIAIIALGPFCDALGMRRLLRFAFLSQAVGILMMTFATGFWTLFAGCLVNGLGSGAVEAACNPLIATIYPDKKTHKLSQFHMWFPGGIVIGGLIAYLFDNIGLAFWQLKLAVVLVPTVAYGLLLFREQFPATERVQAGVSFGEMCKATFLRPLFLVLLVCMMLTASLELGPNRWIPSVLQAGGIPGILVLVWITGLMAVLRLFCGPVVKVLTNTGLLLLSAVVGGAGLFLLSFPANIYVVGVAATVFAFGVCYFWPAMLGTVAERVPKGGALALAVIGGLGGLFFNTVTTPVMGRIADKYLHQELVVKGTLDGKPVDRQAETVAALQAMDSAYAAWGDSLKDTPQDTIARGEIREARDAAKQALDVWRAKATLPDGLTANALRSAVKNGPPDAVEKTGTDAEKAALAAKTRVAAILNPADNKGGLMSFRYVAPLSIILVIVFGVMFIQDRRRARAAAPVTA